MNKDLVVMIEVDFWTSELSDSQKQGGLYVSRRESRKIK